MLELSLLQGVTVALDRGRSRPSDDPRSLTFDTTSTSVAPRPHRTYVRNKARSAVRDPEEDLDRRKTCRCRKSIGPILFSGRHQNRWIITLFAEASRGSTSEPRLLTWHVPTANGVVRHRISLPASHIAGNTTWLL